MTTDPRRQPAAAGGGAAAASLAFHLRNVAWALEGGRLELSGAVQALRELVMAAEEATQPELPLFEQPRS